jgi:hypothetical protein
MSTFSSARPRSKLPIVVVLILIVIATLAGGAYFLRPRLESVPPQITVSPNVDILGVAPVEIQITDTGAGLKSFAATLSQGGTEQRIASEQLDPPVSEKKVAFAVPKLSGVKEGLRCFASPHAMPRCGISSAATRPCWRRISRSISRRPCWSSSPTTAM